MLLLMKYLSRDVDYYSDNNTKKSASTKKKYHKNEK